MWYLLLFSKCKGTKHTFLAVVFACAAWLFEPRGSCASHGERVVIGMCLPCCHSVFPGCTCVTAGTLQSACHDGLCHCDPESGACPCRENVRGRVCDQCAPNHWNFGEERGCEPCDCDPQNSLGTHCNMVRGRQDSEKPWRDIFKVLMGSFMGSVHRPVPLPSRFWRKNVHRVWAVLLGGPTGGVSRYTSEELKLQWNHLNK